MARIQSAGVIRVGVTPDPQRLVVKNAVTGQFEGFDVEIAKLVAQAIFGSRDVDEAFHRTAFEDYALPDRGRLISDGSLDIVLTPLPENDDQRRELDIAGPYFVVRGGGADLPYVIGLRKDDSSFRTFLDDRLAQVFESGEWAAAFDRTLGKAGQPRPHPPTLDRDGSSSPATTAVGVTGATGP